MKNGCVAHPWNPLKTVEILGFIAENPFAQYLCLKLFDSIRFLGCEHIN